MKYDKIVGLKKQQEKENLEIIQREIDAMLRRKERISITTLAKYSGVDRSYFYRNLQAKQMVEDAQLKQGECYNPKKAIFDRATEEVNKQLKRQMILYKRRIKELAAMGRLKYPFWIENQYQWETKAAVVYEGKQLEPVFFIRQYRKAMGQKEEKDAANGIYQESEL